MTIELVHQIKCDHCGHIVTIAMGESLYEHPEFHTVHDFTHNPKLDTLQEMWAVSHYCKKHGDWDFVLKELHKE